MTNVSYFSSETWNTVVNQEFNIAYPRFENHSSEEKEDETTLQDMLEKRAELLKLFKENSEKFFILDF